MLEIFLIIICVLALYTHFEPKLEQLPTGERIIWYNAYGRRGKERVYKIIKGWK